MQFQFRPLEKWPRPDTKNRAWGQFRSTLGDTLDLLTNELWYLNATNLVIEIGLTEDDIRTRDGLPRSDARKPWHPGVIISFTSKHGPLKYMCDKFTDWQKNIRAVAMTLHRLRLAELYGCSSSGEQYQGWKQLPMGEAQSNGMSPQDAAGFVQQHSEINASEILEIPSALALAFRMAAKKCHPDSGGSHESFVKLNKAKAVLEEHHKSHAK